MAGKKLGDSRKIGDSIIKNVEGWSLNKRMKSQMSTTSTPGVITEGMIHHVKGCLQDTSPPNSIILHHGTNNLKSKGPPEQITDNIIYLGTSVKSDENCVFRHRKLKKPEVHFIIKNIFDRK